jgi:hypothetical protein
MRLKLAQKVVDAITLLAQPTERPFRLFAKGSASTNDRLTG